MKRVTLALLLLCSITIFAQDGINYKALIKDNLGAAVASQSIDVRFTIIADAGATPVYSENHTGVLTDANGIVILTIGGGTTTDVFADIAWGDDTHSLKVEIDIEQDGSFVDMGTTQFMSVPYAMQANTATTAIALPGGIDQAYIAALEARISVLESPPPTPAIGDLYQGGYLFYFYEPSDVGYVAGEVHGLIAAIGDQAYIEDQSRGVDWITGGSTQTTTNGGTSAAIGTGQANTTAMMGQAGYSGGAAKVCDDYLISFGGLTYDDWFLPSRGELNLMWTNLADSDSDGTNTGLLDPDNIGGFSRSYYWSSTESHYNAASSQVFDFGFQDFSAKNFTFFVRAVRAF